MQYTNRRGMKVAREKRRLNRFAEQAPVWNPKNPDTLPPLKHKESLEHASSQDLPEVFPREKDLPV